MWLGESFIQPLRAGANIWIKSKKAIDQTLTNERRLDGLPFMPEMAAFCGTKQVIRAIVKRLCDSIETDMFYETNGFVALENVRCYGSAHGGCQANCSILWHPLWLTLTDPVTHEAHGNGDYDSVSFNELMHNGRGEGGGALRTGDVYSCQLTEKHLFSAQVSEPSVIRLISDYSLGNETIPQLAAAIGDVARRKLTGRGVLHFVGQASPTPITDLKLSSGDRVKVKCADDIRATLDKFGRNRGLAFMPAMLRYCELEMTVEARVERLISPETGMMRIMQHDNPLIRLHSTVCDGRHYGLCHRFDHFLWREAWLIRI